MKYVDGFVLCVPKRNLAAYRRMAAKAGKIWREYGALEFRECAGDEIDKVPVGLSFVQLAKPKRGETVLFSWIVYKSKADRNRINAKVMKDPRLVGDAKTMPFDVKRMTMGGFRTLVDL
jgi:uncharacterized protein YbaA (DUF1428 family)